jgi:hypothetical protein
MRKKLFHGAEIEHPYLGRLWISHDVRPPGQDHWEAWNAQGKRAVPGAFTERNLHFQLRSYSSNRQYTVVNTPENPAPAPGEVQRAYQLYRDFWKGP